MLETAEAPDQAQLMEPLQERVTHVRQGRLEDPGHFESRLLPPGVVEDHELVLETVEARGLLRISEPPEERAR